MDASLEYIDMCRRAIPLLDQHLYTKGDFFFREDTGEVNVAAFGYAMPCKVDVWLPRQDQLQEMVVDEGISPAYFLTEELYNDISDSYGRDKAMDRFSSFEQLWLAYVMKEKYGKTWTGSDWK